MDKQNVTLSLPKEILQQAKILAIQRQSSLSGLLTELLIELVESEEQYDAAMRRGLKQLKEARPLYGDYDWSRDELHER